MHRDASLLNTAGSMLVVVFYLITGLSNLSKARIEDHIERMRAFHTPFPVAVHWFGIALQFTGCALLLARWHPEVGVYCFILFSLAVTVIFHRFWSMRDPAQRNLSRLMLLNNIGIIGGLLLLLDSMQ